MVQYKYVCIVLACFCHFISFCNFLTRLLFPPSNISTERGRYTIYESSKSGVFFWIWVSHRQSSIAGSFSSSAMVEMEQLCWIQARHLLSMGSWGKKNSRGRCRETPYFRTWSERVSLHALHGFGWDLLDLNFWMVESWKSLKITKWGFA